MRRLIQYGAVICALLLMASNADAQLRGRFGGGGGGNFGGGSLRGNFGGGNLGGGNLRGNFGGGGERFSGGSVRGNFGGGERFSGGSVRSNLGSGDRFNGGSIRGNLGDGQRFSGGNVRENLGSGERFGSGNLGSNLGNGNTVFRPTERAGERFSGGNLRNNNLGERATSGQLRNFLDLENRPTARDGNSREFNLRDGNVGDGNIVGNRNGALQGEGPVADFLRGQRPGGERDFAGPNLGDRTNLAERANLGDRANAGNLVNRIEGGYFSNAPVRIDNRQQWRDWRVDRRYEVYDQLRDGVYNRAFWFTPAYWARYPYLRWPYYPGVRYWAWATVSAVNRWLHVGWARPYYYYYGENIYYRGNGVYYGDTYICTADAYTEQAYALATSVPEVDEGALEWLPLGVFALTRDGQSSGPEPTMFLQLAVSKEGILSGTLHNTETDHVESIEGMVDQRTQRAAWVVVGQERPIMETGINNLTEDTAPLLIHHADGTTEQWLLIRLEEPQ